MKPTRPLPAPARMAAIVVACALAAALPALAATYKWTDAGGRVVYSDQPPTGGVKYEVVGAVPPPADPGAAKELANKEMEFRKRQVDRAETASKAEKANADTARLRSYCLQLRNQIIGLNEPNVAMYRINDKGERVLMEDGERKAEAEKLDRTMREKNCPAG